MLSQLPPQFLLIATVDGYILYSSYRCYQGFLLHVFLPITDTVMIKIQALFCIY